jgi:hypothetical protein
MQMLRTSSCGMWANSVKTHVDNLYIKSVVEKT